MADHSGEGPWSSDKKNCAIITVLDIAYRSLNNVDHAALLIFIGVLGSWQIPISFIEKFQFFDDAIPDESSSTSDGPKSLQIIHDASFLRLALHRLARSFLIRLKLEGVRIISFTIHRVLCQWSLDHVTSQSNQVYIMQAAYRLSREVCKGGSKTFMLDEQFATDAGDPMIERKFLAPFLRFLSIIPRHISRSELDLHTGRFRAPYAAVLHQAAWAILRKASRRMPRTPSVPASSSRRSGLSRPVSSGPKARQPSAFCAAIRGSESSRRGSRISPSFVGTTLRQRE